MKLNDAQVIGSEMALKWSDGSEQFIALEALRRACPCASCSGEVDVLGNLHKGPGQALGPSSFQILKIQSVGGYALQIFWGDKHNTGLYSYDYLMGLREQN
jgi:DUF971 family protein